MNEHNKLPDCDFGVRLPHEPRLCSLTSDRCRDSIKNGQCKIKEKTNVLLITDAKDFPKAVGVAEPGTMIVLDEAPRAIPPGQKFGIMACGHTLKTYELKMEDILGTRRVYVRYHCMLRHRTLWYHIGHSIDPSICAME